MEPRENRYAVPLTTLVAGAYVPLAEQVALQPVDDGERYLGGGGGADVAVNSDGDGD